MFYQTQTTHRPPKGWKTVPEIWVTYMNKTIIDHTLPVLCTLITPGSDGMVPSAAAWHYLQRARYSALSIAISTKSHVCCLWWPWPLNLSKRETKHIFPVHLTQIRSAVPKVFHTQTKITDSAKNKTIQFTACGNNFLNVVIQILFRNKLTTQWALTSLANWLVQLFPNNSRQKGPILTMGDHFPKIPPSHGGSGPASNSWFLRPVRAHNPNGMHHDRFSCFCTGDRRVSLYLTI